MSRKLNSCNRTEKFTPAVIPSAWLLQSKAETVVIERNSGRQRHWLARFKRKSIVVSKSAEMVEPHHGAVRRLSRQQDVESGGSL